MHTFCSATFVHAISTMSRSVERAHARDEQDDCNPPSASSATAAPPATSSAARHSVCNGVTGAALMAAAAASPHTECAALADVKEMDMASLLAGDDESNPTTRTERLDKMHDKMRRRGGAPPGSVMIMAVPHAPGFPLRPRVVNRGVVEIPNVGTAEEVLARTREARAIGSRTLTCARPTCAAASVTCCPHCNQLWYCGKACLLAHGGAHRDACKEFTDLFGGGRDTRVLGAPCSAPGCDKTITIFCLRCRATMYCSVACLSRDATRHFELCIGQRVCMHRGAADDYPCRARADLLMCDTCHAGLCAEHVGEHVGQHARRATAVPIELVHLELKTEDRAGRRREGGNSKARPCDNCGKPASRMCSRCRKAHYCSRACQTERWRAHKRVCGRGAGAGSGAGAGARV